MGLKKTITALLGVPEPQLDAALPPGLRELRPGDQNYPHRSVFPSMHEKAIADVEARKAIGIERYGVALQPANGRDAVRDWYEEALDGVVYGAQVAWEQDNPQHTYVGAILSELADLGATSCYVNLDVFLPDSVVKCARSLGIEFVTE